MCGSLNSPVDLLPNYSWAPTTSCYILLQRAPTTEGSHYILLQRAAVSTRLLLLHKAATPSLLKLPSQLPASQRCQPVCLLQNLNPPHLQRWRPGIIKYCLPTSSPNPFSNHPISSLIFLLRYDRLYKASYKAPYSRLLTQESHFKPGPPSCHAPPAIPVPPPCQHSTQLRPASRPGPPPPFIQS